MKKKVTIITIFSFIFAIVRSLAKSLKTTGEISISIPQILMLGIICMCIVLILHKCVFHFSHYTKSQKTMVDVKKYCIYFSILMLSYSLCFFTYYPGVSANDGLNIMCFGMGMCTQFPIFYCAFITMLTWIGMFIFESLQVSIALYSVCQILIVCAMTAWLIVWGCSKPLAKWMKFTLGVYYIIEPILAMYAISMLKDTIFSLSLTLLMTMTYELIHYNSGININWKFWGIFTIIILIIILIRNNGFYIVVPFLLIMCAVCVEHRKMLFRMILISIGAIILNALPFWIVHQEALFQERVGIPLQQMAAVVAYDGKYTKEQSEFLSKIMPLDEIKKDMTRIQ